MFGEHDHDHPENAQHVVISLDEPAMRLLNAIYVDLQANNHNQNIAKALAIRAKAISDHLTSVVASLNQLSESNQ